jgi:hypothetical protein
LGFVIRLDKETKSQIKFEKEGYGYPDSHYEQTMKKLDNMWKINKIYLAISTAAFVYSCITLIWANLTDGRCSVVTNIQTIDDFLMLFHYINTMLLWQYPFMYLTWPNKQIKQTVPEAINKRSY